MDALPPSRSSKIVFVERKKHCYYRVKGKNDRLNDVLLNNYSKLPTHGLRYIVVEMARGSGLGVSPRNNVYIYVRFGKTIGRLYLHTNGRNGEFAGGVEIISKLMYKEFKMFSTLSVGRVLNHH